MKNLSILLILICLISCSKPNDTPVETACTSSTKMYLVTKDGGSNLGKDSFAYDNQNKMIYAKFNSSGRVATPANATFTYNANGQINKSVVRQNSNNAIIYTYNFVYRADNKLDSVFRSGTSGQNYKFSYNTSGKLSKVIEYQMPSNTSDFNVVITADENNNITKAVPYFMGDEDGSLSYSFDKKSNPLAGYAFYFIGLDDVEDLVKYNGANNYVDQTAKINTGGSIITVVSGEKHDYNSNCYPTKNYVTINGVAMFPTSPDFIYTYK